MFFVFGNIRLFNFLIKYKVVSPIHFYMYEVYLWNKEKYNENLFVFVLINLQICYMPVKHFVSIRLWL